MLEAEIIFYDANDVDAGIKALRENGCEAEIIPGRFDEADTTATWVKVTVAECEGDLFDWLQAIVESRGGDVLEADLNSQLELF